MNRLHYFIHHRKQTGQLAPYAMFFISIGFIIVFGGLYLANVGASTYHKARVHFASSQIANYVNGMSSTDATSSQTMSSIHNLLKGINLNQYLTNPKSSSPDNDIQINTSGQTVSIKLHNLPLTGNEGFLPSNLTLLSDTSNFPSATGTSPPSSSSYVGSVAIAIGGGSYAFIPISNIGAGPPANYPFQSFTPPSAVANQPLYALAQVAGPSIALGGMVSGGVPLLAPFFNNTSGIAVNVPGSGFVLPTIGQVDYLTNCTTTNFSGLYGVPVRTGLQKQ